MYFPIVCVDNFYSNPDEVREFALSQEFNNKEGNFPGMRTKPLHLINENFFDSFCSKLFSLFYQFQTEQVNWTVESHFQKIYPFDQNKNSLVNEGWIHLDSDDSIAAGVIYLNPNSNSDAGTSFFKGIEPEYKCNWDLRNNFYKKKQVNIDQYLEEKKKNTNAYKKTLEIKNIYNRLSFYGTQYPHRESNFYVSDTEPRLTQIFFVKELHSLSTPIERKNSYEITF